MSALFCMTDVVKHFPTPRGAVRAVDGVSLEIARGDRKSTRLNSSH